MASTNINLYYRLVKFSQYKIKKENLNIKHHTKIIVLRYYLQKNMLKHTSSSRCHFLQLQNQ